MSLIAVRAGALALLAFIAVACAPGDQPSPSAPPATYGDYEAAICGGFTSLLRAYGNPDTNAPSDMRTAFEDAIAAGDPAAAQQAATAMLNELDAGRRLAATAARWEPGATTAASLDQLLLAVEAWTSAKLALMANPSAIDPQTAFEQAGGVEAWTGTLQGIQTTPVPPDASPTSCRAFTGQL